MRGRAKLNYEKRLVSLMNFSEALSIEQLSAGLILGRPYKNRFSSWTGKLAGYIKLFFTKISLTQTLQQILPIRAEIYRVEAVERFGVYDR